jgi:aminopeptidase N
METPADQVMPGRLGTLQYAKTATGLVMLREYVLGPERFDAAFREYVRRWAFKHPQPADFFRTMDDVSGADLSWFWRGWFLETGTLDQAVEGLTYTEAGRPQATFINRGELVMPVEFKVTYDDGTEETRRLPVEVWFYTNRWVAEWDSAGRTVGSIRLDPRELLPDVDAGNNTWTAPEPARPDTGPAETTRGR